jgi:hypothetical protein
MNFGAKLATGCTRWRKHLWRAGWTSGIILSAAALAGCQSAPPHAAMVGPGYAPNNVFSYPPKLSLDLHRVALLPISSEIAGNDLPAGAAALSAALWQELTKTRKFEVVAVDAGALRVRTGRVNWTGAELLPADFFAFLHREYGCDAVLFAELTAYRAQAPMAVGWRLKLVDAQSGQTLWAVDELFDAGNARVARGLQKFQEPPGIWPLFRQDNWVALNSPQQLGRYSAAAVLGTLPER